MSSQWKIWKYELPVDQPEFELEVASGVHLTVQVQDGLPVIWDAVLVNDEESAEKRTRKFAWVMTGGVIPDSVKHIPQSYVGTVQILHGLVMHLFEIYP